MKEDAIKKFDEAMKEPTGNNYFTDKYGAKHYYFNEAQKEIARKLADK